LVFGRDIHDLLIEDELWSGLWVDVVSILGFVERALNGPLKGEIG
jgi:hypothetical protein